MRFLSPLALVGLTLIALPIAIHLLVRRLAQRLDFPSIKFLRETPSFRLRPRRIQQPLLLALRAAGIALLVLGLSAPIISFGTKTSRIHIVLLDASLSMKARGRTEGAKAQARALIEKLGAGERAAIIAFATDGLVLSALTSDKRELSDAIDRYQPTNEPVDYEAGFRTAGRLLQQERDGETLIDVVSDFQVTGLPAAKDVPAFDQLIGHAQVITHPVGADFERNAFLTDEEVTSSESGNEISATDIVIDGKERAVTRRTWSLDSSAGSRGDIDWRTEPNGQITVRIASLTPDDFDPDDSRYFTFESPGLRRVLLIEREGDETVPYLRAALEATVTEVDDRRFKLESNASLPTSPSELKPYSLVILTLHGKPQPDEIRLLAGFVREGGIVWLCMGSDVDSTEWNRFAGIEDGRFLPFERIERRDDVLQGSGFGAIDAEAPALRSMNEQLVTALTAVRMRKGFTVTPRSNSITMIRWNDNTPAFVGTEVGSGSVLLLATSPASESGELGASPTFPALTSSIVKFSIATGEPRSFEIGQSVRLGLAPNSPVKVVDPKGRSSSIRYRDIVKAPGVHFPEAGIYRVEADNFIRYVAINPPKAESESALATAAEVERVFKQPSQTTEAGSTIRRDSAEQHSNAWRYFLFGAFALLIAELFVAIKHGGAEPPPHAMRQSQNEKVG